MNVFYTNDCPVEAALDHNKRHQVKMILEYAQLLSTAHFEIDGATTQYKATHKNHPSAIWCRESVHHYNWVLTCALELCKLYTESTGKVHATQSVLEALSAPPKGIARGEFKRPPVAAPDEFKAIAIWHSTQVAYQKYLVSKFKEWQQRDKPLKVEWSHRTPDWIGE
jgi:hypothetical protein